MTNLITLDPADSADTRNQLLRNTLGQYDCEITFTKVDGGVRTMPCTLREAAMPQREALDQNKTRVYKPETLSVWCLDKNEWRSFRVLNVTELKVL